MQNILAVYLHTHLIGSIGHPIFFGSLPQEEKVVKVVRLSSELHAFYKNAFSCKFHKVTKNHATCEIGSSYV